MRKHWLLLLLTLVGCRSERHVYINDWLEADIKKPPAGIMQLLGPNTTITSRGRTIVSEPSVYYFNFGDTVAIRDVGPRGVVMVTHDGHETDLPCPNGMSVVPERFSGIDCWAGGIVENFAFTRYTTTGTVLSVRKAPKVVSDCGARARMDYMGYDQQGEPVVGYECTVDGRRMCRAIILAEEPKQLAEMTATSPDVNCGYLLRTEHQVNGLTDVQRWTLTGD